MSNKRRVAERNRALMINPSDMGGAFLVPTDSLMVGPGKSGPGDEWQFPTEPIDATAGETVPTAEAAQSTEDEPRRLDR
jgi:hypothetical protein